MKQQHTNFKMFIKVPHDLWICSKEKLKLDFLMWFCWLCRTSRLKSKSNNHWWVLSSLGLQASYNLQNCKTSREKWTNLQLAQILEKKMLALRSFFISRFNKNRTLGCCCNLCAWILKATTHAWIRWQVTTTKLQIRQHLLQA